jgi:hypothetical protein
VGLDFANGQIFLDRLGVENLRNLTALRAILILRDNDAASFWQHHDAE